MAREGWKFLPVVSLLPQLKWQCRQTLRLTKTSLAAWRLPCHTLTAMPTIQRLWLNRTHPIPIGYNYNHFRHLYMSEGVCLLVCVRVYLSPLTGICRKGSRGPNFRIERSLFDTRWSTAGIWFLTVTFYSFSPSFSWCNFTSSGTCLCLLHKLYRFGLCSLLWVCVGRAVCIY